jgi:hypothetical protein
MSDTPPPSGEIVWNGQRFRLGAVLQQAKLGPAITINCAEMHQGLNNPLGRTQHEQLWDADHPDNFPVFYKFEGKYVCLLGHANLNRQQQEPKNKGQLKGRLVSGPMLKKARLSDNQDGSQSQSNFNVEVADNPRRGWVDRDNSAIRNRGRVMDERRSQQYGGAVKNNDRYA